MISVSREVPARPEAVFAVLADGWTYSGWVVGNSHIRGVDRSWPAEGSRIQHSVGAWPFQIQDVCTVVAVDSDRMLELDARLWWFGAARIRFTLSPSPGGGTVVEMEELVMKGPARLLPAPVQALILRPRNEEVLSRLADLAVGRWARQTG